MEKEKWERPELEIIRLETKDIITASSCDPPVIGGDVNSGEG